MAFLAAMYGLGVLFILRDLRDIGSPRDYWAFSILTLLAFVLSLALIVVPERVPSVTDLINRLVSGFALEFFEVR